MMLKYICVIYIMIALCLIRGSHQTRRIRDISSTGSSSGSSPQTNGRIADYAMKVLGTFQRFMKEGNAELGIPTLDPVQMESFNYSLENSPVGFRMQIQFDNPSLMGLSSYELNSASELQNHEGSKLLMTIVFPSVQIKGGYKANGNLFGFFSLLGQGNFDIIASNQVLSAEAKLGVVNQTLIVEHLTSQFVGGRVKSQFTDVNTSGPFSGLMSEFLNAMGTHVFDKKLKPIITVAMNDYMKEWLNGAFSSVSLGELLGTNSPIQQSPSGIGQSSILGGGGIEQIQSHGTTTGEQSQIQLQQSQSQHPLNFQPFFQNQNLNHHHSYPHSSHLDSSSLL